MLSYPTTYSAIPGNRLQIHATHCRTKSQELPDLWLDAKQEHQGRALSPAQLPFAHPMAEEGDLLSLEYALPPWGQEMPSPGALPNRSSDEGTLCVAQPCVTLLRDHEEKRDRPERLPLLRDEAQHHSRIREAIRQIIQHLVGTQHECLPMMLSVTIQN
jgi:hypothetical protein